MGFRVHSLCASLALFGASASFADAPWSLTPANQHIWGIGKLCAQTFPLNLSGYSAVGVALRTTSSFYVGDADGSLYIFPGDSDNQMLPPPKRIGGDGALGGMAMIDGTVYLALRDVGEVVALDSQGNIARTLANNLGVSYGLALNPRNGHLYAGSQSTNLVWDIDPNQTNPGNQSVLMQLVDVQAVSGIATDGLNLYVMGILATDGMSHILKYPIKSLRSPITSSTPTRAKAAVDYGFINGADGVAIGPGGADGQIYVTCKFGQVYQIDSATKAVSLLANWSATQEGHFGCLANVDPMNGSLLISGPGVGRLMPPLGYSLQYATPYTSSKTLKVGQSTVVNVCLALASPVPFNVALSSSDPSIVVPASVTIPAGASNASFTMTSAGTTSAGPATVTATLLNVSRSVTIEIAH